MKRLVIGLTLLVMACGPSEERLINRAAIVGDTLPQPLTEQIGDPERGRTIFAERDIGHCVLCHVVSDLDVTFQGDIGPDLSTVGDRLSADQLRLRIVDYQIVRPGAVMPSYYRIQDLHQVGEDYRGAPILAAQDIEDLIAYLSERVSASRDDG